MGAHALVTASGAHRWLACPPSVRFEQQFPAETSQYAEEGTLAHEVCELLCRKKFRSPRKSTFDRRMQELRKNPLWQDEMLKTAEFYVDYLTRKAMEYSHLPYVMPEVRVNLSNWIPEGFGTCDCVMLGDDTLHITDYKHGKGVVVDAHNNPQMRLYALGALMKYFPVYGKGIQKVSMAIVQPRVTEDVSEECIPVGDLLEWGDLIRPVAKMAYNGKGEFAPGEHCRFCRARAKCRARADVNTALEEFKDCTVDGRVLTDTEIGNLLARGADLVAWYNDLKDYAFRALMGGKAIPGYKVVEGRSNRRIADEAKAVKLFGLAGYAPTEVFTQSLKPLGELEKVVGGKGRLEEILSSVLVKPPGKPTLVPECDRRERYSPAVADFEGVT